MTDDTDPSKEDQLHVLARQTLEPVSDDVARRLAEMRGQALSQINTSPAVSERRLSELFTTVGRWSQSWAGLAAASAVVLIAIVLRLSSTELLEMPVTQEGEIAVVQDMELLEDLEFLTWLEEEGSEGAG